MKDSETDMEKGELRIPCSRCGALFKMAQLSCRPKGDSLECLACISSKKVKKKIPDDYVELENIPTPSAPGAMTIEAYEKQEKEKKQAREKVQVKKNFMQEFKCMNCGYSLKKRELPQRCPYCGKATMHKQVGLIRDIDVIGRY